MNIIDPRRLQFAQKRRQRHSRTKKLLVVICSATAIAGLYATYCLKRPLPSITPVRTAQISVPAQDVPIAWPAAEQSALGAVGYGLLAKSGAETPRPIASIAKVMTALAVLKKYPLEAGQKGPAIMISQADIKSYYDYLGQNGSVVPVSLGSQLTQYQALQGLLIPSGNNIADLLVRWAFGSVDSYVAYANSMAKELGLSQTTIADASGFSAQTVSTPSDLVKLGLAALENPVVAEIVSQPSAELPVAGTVRSTNAYLGKGGVIGIKTGNTDQAGGCFLLAAQHDFGSHKAEVVIAIMNAKDINAAMTGAVNALPSVWAGFGAQPVIGANEVVGHYNVPWQGSVSIATEKELNAFGWLGKAMQPEVSLDPVTVPAAAQTKVGSIALNTDAGTAQTGTVLAENISAPSAWWRLTHPY